MRHLTNRERQARKEAKAMAIVETKKAKQLHVNGKDSRNSYRQIISLVKTKITHVKSQRFTDKGIIKLIDLGRVLFNNGTYVKKIHGELKTR